MSRTRAFHHLNRRKAAVADTGLHEFKDLQKTAVTSPLLGEGIVGPEFEKKLKDTRKRQTIIWIDDRDEQDVRW